MRILGRAGIGVPRAKVTLAAAQTLTSGVTTAMKLDTVVYDPYGMFVNSGLSTAGFVIPKGWGGQWGFKGGVSYPANGAADGTRRIVLLTTSTNGNIAQNDAPNILAAVGAQREAAGDDEMEAGDSIQLFGRQDSGGNLITPGGIATFLTAIWLGPLIK